MPTLYVENVPEQLYESLRKRARANRRSISAETIVLLERALPTPAELRRREIFYRRIQRFTGKPGPSTEVLLREDRER